jgi:hypothetical protein
MEPPAKNKEESMEENKTDSSIANDVLHSDHPSKLTPEEIAKAVAHHNRHHGGDGRQTSPSKGGQGKKQGAGKPK